MIGKAAQDVGEPRLWIDAVEVCRGDQSLHGCPLSGTVRRDLMTGGRRLRLPGLTEKLPP
jgi:hypothetical protein